MQERAECLSWLFWQMGSAPYLGGGFGHFYAYAPEKMEYPINRFAMEVKRQLDVLDRRLAESRIPRRRQTTRSPTSRSGRGTARWSKGLLYDAGEFLQVHDYSPRAALGRPDRRPACGQARAHGQPHLRRAGQPAAERHDASDFDTKTQDKMPAKA